MEFVGQTYDNTEMTLDVYTTGTYIKNNDSSEWTLDSMSATRKSQYFQSESDEASVYDVVTFTLMMTRKGDYYWYSYVIPTIITSMMTILG
jgi:hypothetical protein